MRFQRYTPYTPYAPYGTSVFAQGQIYTRIVKLYVIPRSPPLLQLVTSIKCKLKFKRRTKNNITIFFCKLHWPDPSIGE